ncbi:MAG TPA: sterol carrier family protein [Pseudonocardia sp.]|nr:sterol carrier family protein [Pseudonocardia sp.]
MAPGGGGGTEAGGTVTAWLDGGPQPDRATLKAAVRASLAELARRAPGRSVEVRVPPFGAVQCLAGPRHTRGTPPNVVETDARTWLALAAGRESWADARGRSALTASGHRADEVAALLPLDRPAATPPSG